MRSFWGQLQSLPRYIRWPLKGLIFAAVTLLVLYPRPALLLRHIEHLRRIDVLPDPHSPALQPVLAAFDRFVAATAPAEGGPSALLGQVQQFVYRQIAYGWDWDVWGVADYIPTLEEVIRQGREDCDGRAVLAAALLRAKGIDAHLVAGNGHVWVATPLGETMSPIGRASLRADPAGLHGSWTDFFNARTTAYGVAVFPWVRELVILLTLWLLLLPRRVDGPRAALAMFLLLGAVMMLRLAGADVRRPRLGGIWWGYGQLLAAIGLLVFNRRFGRDRASAGIPRGTS